MQVEEIFLQDFLVILKRPFQNYIRRHYLDRDIIQISHTGILRVNGLLSTINIEETFQDLQEI